MNVKLRVLSAGVLFFLGGVASAQTVADTIVSDIEEVVVVGYGTKKKETLTGSVASVQAEEIAKVTTSNVVQGMNGKVAGVQIAAGSGQPGQAPVVRFRGIGSINGSSEPLYIVDGVPLTGSITSINNNDIESMSFLKDASLASMYGNRGANGVIIITTKKGRRGTPKFNLDLKTGVNVNGNKRYKTIDDPARYYEAYFQGLTNNYMFGQNLSYNDARTKAAAEIIDGAQGLGYNIFNTPNDQLIDPVTGKIRSAEQIYSPEKWEDFLFRPGYYNSVFLNASGGTDVTSYYFSLGYEKNEGYAINSRFDKITARGKIDTQIGDRIKIGTNMAYTNAVLDNPDGNGTSNFSSPYLWINSIGPIYGVYLRDNNGNIMFNNTTGEVLYDDGSGLIGPNVRPYGQRMNPYITALRDIKRTDRNAVVLNGYLDVNILEGLDFKYSITGDYLNADQISMDTPLYGDAVDANGRLTGVMTNYLGVTNQQLLTYVKNFGGHKLDLLAGHETYVNRVSQVYSEKSNLFLPETNILDQAAVLQGTGGSKGKYATEGYFGRINYEYGQRYYLTANVRRDASSYFHPDNRWGTFYGFGGAWRVTNESFMNDISWLNEFKLKASYGEQGNDDLNFPVYTPYERHYTVDQTTDASLPLSYSRYYNGNKDITWEKMKNLNAGFELGLFNKRLNIDAEYFERNVSDMLFQIPLAPSVSGGWTSLPKNVGSMENKGVEISIDADVIKSNDFRLNIFANATHYKNKVTALDGGQAENKGLGLKVGEDRYIHRMREFAGVDHATGYALFYKDVVDGSGNVVGRTVTDSHADATIYWLDKTATPDVYGGFGLRADFKGIDFSIDFAYQLGGWGYDSNWLGTMGGGLGQSIHEDFYKTWTPENPGASLPKFSVENNMQTYSGSSLALIKSDYLSIQNITIGYTLKRDWYDGLGLTAARFYFGVNNAALFSKRQGYDPRLSIAGTMGSGTYNLNRTLIFGTNISF